MKLHLLSALLATLIASPGLADFQQPQGDQELDIAWGAMDERGLYHSSARLVADVSAIAPGDSFNVGVLIRLDTNWHTYWRNPGEAALPARIDFASTGAGFGQLKWPAPTAFDEGDGMFITYGYKDHVLLSAPAKAGSADGGQLDIRASVTYLVCELQCVPAFGELQLSIPIADRTEHGPDAHLFAKAFAALPITAAGTGLRTSASYAALPTGPGQDFMGRLRVDLCGPGGDPDCTFAALPVDPPWGTLILAHAPSLELRVQDVRRLDQADDAWEILVDGKSIAPYEGPATGIAGLLYVATAGGQQAIEVEFPVTASVTTGTPQAISAFLSDVAMAGSGPAGASAEPVDLWTILLFAFLGGIILNLMPCVFPVLALKVAAFAELVHEDRSGRFIHGLAYTAGVVGSMLLLGFVVVALKSAGTAVGWGFQFQHPAYIAVVAAVVTVFTLNLLDVFVIGVTAGSAVRRTDSLTGTPRSIAEGVLTVILATPCSAPFLGSAMGLALAGSGAVTFAAFAAVGLGLAFPFVGLTFVPGVARLLPSPGPWMGRVKKILALLLLATIIWLAWLMLQAYGTSGLVRMLAFLVAVSAATLVFGKVQFKAGRDKWTPVGIATALVVAVSVFSLRFGEPAAVPTESLRGSPWSAEAVQSNLANGNPVLVDFTADWCITCKVNESSVLDSDAVQDAIQETGTVVLIADWTTPDELIRKELARFGRGGVPMYLVYSPSAPDNPNLLPELITRSMVIKALEQAAN